MFATNRSRTDSDIPEPPSIEQLGGEPIDPAIVAVVEAARKKVLDDPQSPTKWGDLGKVLSAHAFNDEAAICFGVAAQLEPSSQRWAYLHARCVLPTDPDRALSLLEQCADMPGDPLDTPRLFLVERLLENQKLDQAEALLEQSLAKNPNNTRARFAKARLLFMRESYAACKDEIIATHEDVQRIYQGSLNQAKELKQAGRNDEAQNLVEDAQRRVRESLCQQRSNATLLARTYLQLGDVEASRQQQQLANEQSDSEWPDPYTRGISKLKTGLRAMLSDSDIAFSQGRFTDALATLDRAVALYPESLFVRIRLGRLRIRLGKLAQDAGDDATATANFEEARRQLKAAEKLDNNSPEVQFRLGVLYMYWANLPDQSTRLEASEKAFRKAIAIKPDFAMAHYNLARCLDKQKKSDAAIAAMRESLKFDPNHLPAQRALGGLLMKAGMLREAVVELEKVVETSPGDKKAQTWLKMLRRDLQRQQ